MQPFRSILHQHNDQKSNIDPGHKKASSFFKPIIQPKLSVNQPNDVYEQEADAIADKVMRMPDHAENNNSFFRPAVSSIQRKCAACEEEDKQLQRKESNSDSGNASSQTEDYINALSGGKPLAENEKSFFESSMGYDFSDVRLHTDPAAARSAQSINALAYTSGNNIVFNAGQYAPGTNDSKRLLAHELTHVVQQQNNAVFNSLQRAVFVCDEYKTVSPTTYNPGPGLSLSLSGHAVTIRANLELYGAGATSAIAGEFKSTIENYWNHTYDDGYSVKTTANVTVQGDKPDKAKTRIDVINAKGVTNVAPTYWIAGANYMQYYIGSSKNDWTPAHEFGHLLGLPDHYSESIASSLKGQINPDWRTSIEDKGWEGNLMARTGGVFEKKNIVELISIGFKTKQECVRGHHESPL
jgi:hypothetical protein